MTISLYLAVAGGGFVGAPCRYLFDRAFSRRFESDRPWGTFFINCSGSFLLGLLTGLVIIHRLSPLGNALAGTGFCGAYTTFSAFTFETVRLVQKGQILEAASNVVVSLLVGLAAATAGLALGLAA